MPATPSLAVSDASASARKGDNHGQLDFSQSPPESAALKLGGTGSGLSATRPAGAIFPNGAVEKTTAAAHAIASTSKAAPSSRAATQDTLAVLLTTLSADDGESILSIAVEEARDARDDHHRLGTFPGGGSSSREPKRQAGRVYGGSQGGNIHVSQAVLLAGVR